MKTRWNLMMVIVLLAALLVILMPAQPVQADDVAIKFIQVSAGEWHTCAVASDGNVACWGDDRGYGMTKPPQGVLFKQVSVGTYHSCGITTSDTIRCWGTENGGRISDAPAGTFKQISVSVWHACGLRTNGTIDCWGIQAGGRTDDPPGTFIQVNSSLWHNCALDTNHHAYCWGSNDAGKSTPPTFHGSPYYFQKVSVGPWHSCAIGPQYDIIYCWGDDGGTGRTQYHTGPESYHHHFTDISAGYWHTCALGEHPEGPGAGRYIHCWGSNADGRTFPYPGYLNQYPGFTGGGFKAIEAGRDHTCVINMSDSINCWGYNGDGQAPPEVTLQNGPTYTVNNTAPTNDHVCTNLDCTLLEAIETANRNSIPSTIELTAGAVYMLQEDAGDGAGFRISTPMVINGNGATIRCGLAAIRMAVVDSTGELLLKNVTVRDFHTSTLDGGVILNNGILTIYGSTLVHNLASTGGAIFNNGTLTIANSTLTGNTAVYFGGAVVNYPDGVVTVLSSTFANNDSPYIGDFQNYGTLTLKNTLLIKGGGVNCAGIEPGLGSIGNMADDSSCGASTAVRTTAQINLGALTSNGGLTQTMALLAGSQAIDQGNTTACQSSLIASHDQRGYNRFADGPDGDTVAQCDIGAFEYGSTEVVQGPTDDTTAPLVTILQAPEMPDGANGWYRGPVTLQPSATDEFEVIDLRCALDPVAPPASFDDLPQERCAFLEGAPVSADGAHTLYAAALDINDNQSEVVSASFQIDATPPAITCPAAGPFLLGSGEQPIGPAGVDASVSGLDEAASMLSGFVTTDSVGPKILTFTAFDLAGNSASQDCSYDVIYDFAGFYPPVEPAPALNDAKAGSAIPLKFSLAGDQGLEVFAAGYPSSQLVACDTLEPVGDLSPIDTASHNKLSYDPLTGWYNAVWKTDASWYSTCRMLILQLIDGTQHIAYFQFK